MNEIINLNSKEEKEENSFKEYIRGVISDLKEQREGIYKNLSGIKTSFDYLENFNANDDEAVIQEKASLEAKREELEEEKENLRNKILFYGILENANNPEEVISEYRENKKIDEAEAEAILNFLYSDANVIQPEVFAPDIIKEEEAAESKEVTESGERKAEKETSNNIDEEEDEDDYSDSLNDIIASLPEEKRAIFNKVRNAPPAAEETREPISFLKYREQMKKERKADFLKADIQKLEKEAEEAKNNREYRKFAEIGKDIIKLKKKLWWYLSPEEREILKESEKEERKVSEKQYKRIMKGSGISGSRGAGREDDSYYEAEELRPSYEELALSSEIEKLRNTASSEYRKIRALNKRIEKEERTLYFFDDVEDKYKTFEEKLSIETDRQIKLPKLHGIIRGKIDSLRKLFWRINYLKIEIVKLHNEQEWEKDKDMGLGHTKDDIGQEMHWFTLNEKLPKKTAFELAFDKLGGQESAKNKLGLIKKEESKAKALNNGSKALLKKKIIKKAPASKGGASKKLNT